MLVKYVANLERRCSSVPELTGDAVPLKEAYLASTRTERRIELCGLSVVLNCRFYCSVKIKRFIVFTSQSMCLSRSRMMLS